MADQTPADLEQVREAFRLGWVVSELRGRCEPARFDHPLPAGLAALIPPRLPHALPLSTERKPGEVRIELTECARQLSKALTLDMAKLEAAATLREAMEKKGADLNALWPSLADAFYKWDAFIQDTLLLEATQGAAYQLGRGLADTYWALDPTDGSKGMSSCRFLLGEERYETLYRLVLRLSAYLDPLTIAAVGGSLKAWYVYISGLSGRQGFDAKVTLGLYKQGLLWRDLFRGERRPQDLVNDPLTPSSTSEDAWNEARPYWQALKALRGPITAGATFAALLVAGAALLAAGATHTELSAAITVLGGLGLTSATLYARAKAQIVSLFESFSASVAAKKVARAADLAPVDKGAASVSSSNANNQPKERAMAQVDPFHTNSEEYPPSHRDVYHDQSECGYGKEIKPEHRRSGTGGRPRCKECELLGS